MTALLTQAQAKAKGYTVDTCCYPHVGYKGARFAPDDLVHVLTEREEQLLESTKGLTRIVEAFGYTTKLGKTQVERLAAAKALIAQVSS